jgi:hypothetical protein
LDTTVTLYVGHAVSSGKALVAWDEQTISDLSQSNGFLILPISGDMNRYASYSSYDQYLNDMANALIEIKKARTDKGLPANIWLSAPQAKITEQTPMPTARAPNG